MSVGNYIIRYLLLFSSKRFINSGRKSKNTFWQPYQFAFAAAGLMLSVSNTEIPLPELLLLVYFDVCVRDFVLSDQ
jgi:hypothetical protein